MSSQEIKVAIIEDQDGIANDKALLAGESQKGLYRCEWGYKRLLGWLIPKSNEGEKNV